MRTCFDVHVRKCVHPCQWSAPKGYTPGPHNMWYHHVISTRITWRSCSLITHRSAIRYHLESGRTCTAVDVRTLPQKLSVPRSLRSASAALRCAGNVRTNRVDVPPELRKGEVATFLGLVSQRPRASDYEYLSYARVHEHGDAILLKRVFATRFCDVMMYSWENVLHERWLELDGSDEIEKRGGEGKFVWRPKNVPEERLQSE